MCGSRPSSRPTMNTTGNSSPLAACSVISVTASTFSSYSSVSVMRAASSRNVGSAASGASSSYWAATLRSSCDVVPAVLAVLELRQQVLAVVDALQQARQQVGDRERRRLRDEVVQQLQEGQQRLDRPRREGMRALGAVVRPSPPRRRAGARRTPARPSPLDQRASSSSVRWPMPRAGTLMTRSRLRLSNGLWMSRR